MNYLRNGLLKRDGPVFYRLFKFCSVDDIIVPVSSLRMAPSMIFNFAVNVIFED